MYFELTLEAVMESTLADDAPGRGGTAPRRRTHICLATGAIR